MDRVVESNRRDFGRLSLELAIPYRISGNGEGRSNGWSQGCALNLSAGGVLLRADRPTAEEMAELRRERRKVVLELQLEDRVLCVTARLAWSDDLKGTDECRLGLRFLDLDTAEQEFLWRWILARKNA